MSPRDWERRIEDILEAIHEIQAFTDGMAYEEFQGDAKSRKAVGADLMIIGEAANNVPEQVRSANPQVPWHLMRAIRNRLIHVYFDIDAAILWQTAKEDLPALVEPLRHLLAGTSDESE